MTGPRFRRLLVLFVVAVVLRRALRVLRGDPTRAFDRNTDRPTPPQRPGVDQQSPHEVAPPAAPSDELPFAPPVTKRPAPPVEPPAVASPDWVAPVEGSCPEGYPVKAKLGSGIFHLPGMSAYDRTTPDRCYPNGDAAVADGLRVAKR